MKIASLLVGTLAALSCGGQSSAPRACIPGITQPCACPGGQTGSQSCAPDGAGFGSCGCGASVPARDGGGSSAADVSPGQCRTSLDCPFGQECELALRLCVPVSTPAPLDAAPVAELPPRAQGACSPAHEGFIACDVVARSNALLCHNAKYEPLYSCPSGVDCVLTDGDDSFFCGRDSGISYTKAGLACTDPNGAACSFDRGVVNWCFGGTWVEARHCAPVRCSAIGPNTLACDNEVAAVGDRCKGGYSCSVDQSQILECASNHLVPYRPCAAPLRCSVDQMTNTVGCR
jgi:hypothetical protein